MPDLLTIEGARKIDRPIVYGLCDDQGIFYVGQTRCARQRFSAHRRGEGVNIHLIRKVRKLGDRLRVVVLHEDPEDINAAELAEIRSRPRLLNLMGRPGFLPQLSAEGRKPWQAGRGVPSPSQWARRVTGDQHNTELLTMVERMTDAERCGYEIALLQGFHPIVQARFKKWLTETRQRMLECLNDAIEAHSETAAVR